MILKRIQDLIGGIYDVPIAHDVYDFLVTERTSLAQPHPQGACDEELIIVEESDVARVSLYLDPELLERLRCADPLEHLHAGNVADYWTALEGVSHFVYFAWNAGHDKPVSILELEMQAEIDKYVASSCASCSRKRVSIRLARAVVSGCIAPRAATRRSFASACNAACATHARNSALRCSRSCAASIA
jgi:hypothetical protein